MFEPIFNQEQKDKLNQSIAKKDEGIFTPFSQSTISATQENINKKSVGIWTDNTPVMVKRYSHLTEDDRKNLGLNQNIFAIARAKPIELPENPTQADYELYERQMSEISEARAKVEAFEYNSKQDRTKNKKIQDLVAKYGLTFDTVSKEDLEFILSQEIMSEWNSVTDEFGAPNSELINDTKFMKYASPDVYRYMATAYNLKNNNGFTGKFANAWTSYEWNRVNDLRLKKGKISYSDYLLNQRAINDRFATHTCFDNLELPDEVKDKLEDYGLTNYSHWFNDTVGVMSGMWQPIGDNPLQSAGIIVGAGIAGTLTGMVNPNLGLSVGSGILSLLWAGDTKDLLDAQGLAQVWSKNPNLDREYVLDKLNPYSMTGSLLDVGSNALIGVTGGLSKLVTAPFKSMAKKAISKEAVALASKAAGKKASKKELEKEIFRAGMYVAGETAFESATEGAQDALMNYGANKILGHPDIKEAVEVGTDSAINAFVPSLFYVGVGNSIHYASLGVQYYSNVGTVEKTVKNVMANVLNSEVAKSFDNKELASKVIGATDKSVVYISNKNDLNKAFTKTGIGLEDTSEEFQNIYNNAKDGEEIEVPTSVLVTLDDNLQKELSLISSDKAGGINVSESMENLTPEKLEEFRKQAQIEGEKYLKRKEKEKNIETQIAKALRENSPSTSVKQNSAIAKVSAIFYGALSQVTGIDVEQLYKDNQISFENNTREVAGKEDKLTDFKNVKATYNRGNGLVSLKKSSSFTDVFHEVLHHYFTVMNRYAYGDKQRGIAPNEKIRKQVEQFNKWAKVAKATSENEDYRQEAFTHAFLAYLIAGQNLDLDILKSLSQMLKQMHSDFSYSAIGAKSKEAKAKVQKDNFEQAYGFNKELPDINSDFIQFVNGMFEGGVAVEQVMSSYPLDNILNLENLENDPLFKELPDSDRATLIKELKENTEKGKDQTTAAIESFNVLRILKGLILKSATSAEEFILKARESLEKEKNIKNKEILKSLYNKLLKATKQYQEVFNQAKEDIAKEDFYVFLEALKAQPFTDYGLTQQQIKDLKKLGLVSDNLQPNSTDVYQYANVVLPNTKSELGQRINSILDNMEGDRMQNFIKYLTSQPTIEQKAKARAEAFLDRATALIFTDKSLQIENTFAKAHKAIGKVFIKHLTKLSKTSVEAKTIIDNIKTLATHDVSKLSMNDAKTSSYFANARRALKRLKEFIAQGDLKNALITSRNELYWNTKAEITNDFTLNSLKRLEKLRTLVNRSKEDIVKTYDFETTQVIKAVLQRIGLVSLKEKIDVNAAIDRIIEDNPDVKEYFESLRNAIDSDNSFNTYFKETPFENLFEVIHTLEDLKSYASLNNAFKSSSGISNYEKWVKASCEALDQHSNKVDDLALDKNENGEVVGSMTPKNKNLKRAISDIIHDYFGYTDTMEHACQRIDLQEFGGPFQSMFQMVHEGVTKFKESYNKDIETFNNALKKIGQIRSDPFDVDMYINVTDKKGNRTGETIKWRLGARGTKYQGRTTMEVAVVLLQMGANFDIFLKNNIADNESINSNPNIKDKAAAQLEYKREKFKKEFIEKGIEQGFITNELLDFCQTVWDFFEKKNPDMQKSSLLMRGYTFKKVENRKWHIEYTSSDGKNAVKRDIVAGYVPAKVQKKFSREIARDENFSLQQISQDTQEENATRTPNFLKDRIEGIRSDMPIDLDIDAILGMVGNVNAYCYSMPAAYKAYRLLNDPRVKAKLERVRPNFYKNVAENWLYCCATMKTSHATSPLFAFIGKLGMGVTQALMVINLKNVLEQTANIPASIIKTGPQAFLKSSTHLNPFAFKHYKDEIAKMSPTMRIRFEQGVTAFNEVLEQIIIDSKQFTTPKEKAKAIVREANYFSERYGMAFQHVFQNYLDVISFMAGMERASKMKIKDWSTGEERFLTEKEQIAYAEQVVRQTQVDFGVENTSKLAKAHPLAKMFTMFGNYFYTMLNTYYTTIYIALAKHGILSTEFAYASFVTTTFGLMSQSIISELVNSLIGQGDFFADDDDVEDQMYLRFKASPFMFVAAGLPFVGQFLNSAINAFTQQSALVRTGVTSPIISVMQNATHAATKAFNGKDYKASDLKATLIALSVIASPIAPVISSIVGPLSRPISATYGIATGEITPHSTYDLIRYLMTGTPSPQSKNGR